MLRRIVLHGRLATEYTDSIELDADDLTNVVFGLNSNFPGFYNDFVAGEWHILKGAVENNNDMKPEEVGMMFGETAKEIHIFPRIQGAGGDSFWGVILGVAIIAVAFWAAPAAGGLGATAFSIGGAGITFGNIAMFGLSMALSGIAGMLAPTPEVGDYTAAEGAADRPSFLFNGPVNVMAAGGPVPLVYGRHEVGSTVISAGVSAERL